MARKAYRSEKITVSFDLQRYIHAIECTWDLPEVCDTEKSALGHSGQRPTVRKHDGRSLQRFG